MQTKFFLFFLSVQNRCNETGFNVALLFYESHKQLSMDMDGDLLDMLPFVLGFEWDFATALECEGPAAQSFTKE